MDSLETISKVREELGEIEKIFDWMVKSREIHQIDIDVLLGKTRKLYDRIFTLIPGTIGSQPFAEPETLQVPVEKEAISIPVPVPVAAVEPVPEPVIIQLPQVQQEAMPEAPAPVTEPYKAFQSFEQPVQPQPITEPVNYLLDEDIPLTFKLIEPKPEPVRAPEIRKAPEPAPIFPTFQPAPKQEKHAVRETISEISLFQRDSSLNETLGKQKPIHDVASSITDIPVSDIWSAITINERFLFIRELFGNDSEGFKNTVTLLNSLSTWEAAQKFMNDRYEWDKNNPVAIDFLNVVRRRFLK